MGEKFTKKDFQNLVYTNIAKEEQQLDMSTVMFLLNDEEVLSVIKQYHNDNKKCAVVCILEKEQFPDGFVAGYNTILDFFNFKQVKLAIDSYDPDTEICYLFVRNNKITANTVGSVNREQKKVFH